MLELHYWPTPNGKKVTILLAELDAEYDLVQCAIGKGDQFKPDFISANPNTRMPLLIDRAPEDGGAPLSIFESGAILMYVAERYGRFYGDDARQRHTINQWVMWQMANQGPKTGELGHFRRLGDSEGDQSYAVRRFDDEVNRIYGVLNYQLSKTPYLVGDDYTIADMACYPWAAGWQTQQQDIDEFPHFKRWFEELTARPAVEAGMNIGADWRMDPSAMSAEEREALKAMLYNQRASSVFGR